MKASIAMILVATLSVLGGRPALSDEHPGIHCSEPKQAWQPQMTLQRELKAKGWRVRRILVTSGCYEVYGFDERKQRVEAFFNPRTFERIAVATGQ